MTRPLPKAAALWQRGVMRAGLATGAAFGASVPSPL